jgi:predicted DNA-binding ribbon-helix-helix protein
MPVVRRYNPSRLASRNVLGDPCRISIRLEPELWEALDEICKWESVKRDDLVRWIRNAPPEILLTSAFRIFILQYLS